MSQREWVIIALDKSGRHLYLNAYRTPCRHRAQARRFQSAEEATAALEQVAERLSATHTLSVRPWDQFENVPDCRAKPKRKDAYDSDRHKRIRPSGSARAKAKRLRDAGQAG